MAHFADSSFFIALHNKSDDHHKEAQEIFLDIKDGKYGKLETSDYILDEGVTVTRQKTNDHNAAMNVGRMINDSVYTMMNRVVKAYIDDAFESYRRNPDKTLSFTDWVSYHMIQFRGLGGIISFDGDFDEVGVPRVPEKKKKKND